jgi:hypothetical protein
VSRGILDTSILIANDVTPHGGGVVLAAGSHFGGPQGPAVRAVMICTLPPWLSCLSDH